MSLNFNDIILAVQIIVQQCFTFENVSKDENIEHNDCDENHLVYIAIIVLSHLLTLELPMTRT